MFLASTISDLPIPDKKKSEEDKPAEVGSKSKLLQLMGAGGGTDSNPLMGLNISNSGGSLGNLLGGQLSNPSQANILPGGAGSQGGF